MLISFVPSLSLANENTGKFSRVLEGAPSPFDAWCFDDVATAKMQASLEYAKDKCQLTISRLLEERESQHLLEVGNLEARIETLQKTRDNLIAIKDQEILRLEEAALKRPNDYSVWWATGGVAVGVLTTLAIVLEVNN
jgi:hypothetical protein